MKRSNLDDQDEEIDISLFHDIHSNAKIDTNKKLKIIIINNNQQENGSKSPNKRRIRTPTPERTKSDDDGMSDSEEKSPKPFIPIPGVKLLNGEEDDEHRFKRPRRFIKFNDEQNNAIVYEMDDSDFDCLKKINTQQKKNGKKVINEDLFEKILCHLEVYWFELKNTNHAKSKDTDLHTIPFRSTEDECCICLNKGSTVSNPKKTCKECGVSVHAYCSPLNKDYIIRKSEESSTEIVDNESYTTRCVCGNDRDTDNMIQCDSCGTWQHMKCEGIDVNVNFDNTFYKCHGCKKIEEEDLNWLCHWCLKVEKPQKQRKNSKRKNEVTEECHLCGYGRTLDDFNSIMGTYYWNTNRNEVAIHLCCAFFHTKSLESIQSHLPINFAGRKMLEKIEKEMSTKKCTVCTKSTGHVVKCSTDKCNEYFHAFCALSEKYHVEFDPERNLFEKIDLKYYCSKHSKNYKRRDNKSIWMRCKDHVKSLFQKQLSPESFEIIFEHWIDMRLIVHKNGIIPLVPVLKVLQHTEDDESLGVCAYDDQNIEDIVFTLIDDVFYFNYRDDED